MKYLVLESAFFDSDTLEYHQKQGIRVSETLTPTPEIVDISLKQATPS